MTHTSEFGFVVDIAEMDDGHLYNTIVKKTRRFRNSQPKPEIRTIKVKCKDDNLFKQEIAHYVLEAIMRDMDIKILLKNIRKELNYE